MSNLSPNNRIINSINRSRYIDKLKGNIGVIKENNKTPIKNKVMDKLEKLKSSLGTRNIIILLSIFLIVSTVLYYFKPSYVMKTIVVNTESNNSKLKITSNKSITESVVKVIKINYLKLIIYSIIITIIIYCILYFMKDKSQYIKKIFNYEN
jgi:hypothetical protein